MAEERPDWYQDKVYGYFTNHERPGDDIVGCINGMTFQIQDGVPVAVPRAYVNCINDAVIIDWKIEDGKPPVQRPRRRFGFTEVSQVPQSDSDKLKEEIAGDIATGNRERKESYTEPANTNPVEE